MSSALLLVSMQPARANAGFLDQAYGAKGSTFLPLPASKNEHAVALVPGWNGGSVVISFAYGYNGDHNTYVRLRSLTRSGTIDVGFNHGRALAWKQGDGVSDEVILNDAIQRTSDHSLIVMTGHNKFTGDDTPNIVDNFMRRISRSGSVDQGFLANQGSGQQAHYGRMTTLSDGRIRTCVGDSVYGWNADGGVDASLGTNGVQQISGLGLCAGITTDHSNRLLLTAVRNQHLVVARTDKDANLDQSFGTLGITEISTTGREYRAVPYRWALSIGPDGSLFVAGMVKEGPHSFRPFLARFYTNGKLASSFGYGGVSRFVAWDSIDSLLVTSHMRIIIGLKPSPREYFRGTLLGVNGFTGKLDTSFGNRGFLEMPGPTAGLVQDRPTRFVAAATVIYNHTNNLGHALVQARGL